MPMPLSTKSDKNRKRTLQEGSGKVGRPKKVKRGPKPRLQTEGAEVSDGDVVVESLDIFNNDDAPQNEPLSFSLSLPPPIPQSIVTETAQIPASIPRLPPCSITTRPTVFSVEVQTEPISCTLRHNSQFPHFLP